MNRLVAARPLAASNNLTYEVKIDAAGRMERIDLNLDRQAVAEPFRGTVLLLHGFRVSKEFIERLRNWSAGLSTREEARPDYVGSPRAASLREVV